MTQRNTVQYHLDVFVMTASQHTSDNDAFVLLKNLTRFRVVFKTNFRKSSYAKAHLLFQKVLLKISFCKLRLQSFFQKESPQETTTVQNPDFKIFRPVSGQKRLNQCNHSGSMLGSHLCSHQLNAKPATAALSVSPGVCLAGC